MKILISSLIDLKKSSHNSRLHQFIRHLSYNHEISVVSINDWWKPKWDQRSEEYQKDFISILDGLDYTYISEKKISPILQEIISIMEPRSIRDILKRDFDIHFSYNSLICGYAISKRFNTMGINTIYDLADDLPEMARTSPQIPGLLKPLSGLMSAKMLEKNIKLAEKVTYTTESLRRSYDIPDHKSVIIPNGVDTDLFKPYENAGLKSDLGIDDECFVIGHVGVLREWLDFEPLFKAIKVLSGSNNIKMLIVGGGIGLNHTKKLASRYGISNNIIFTGTLPYSKVPRYISCMDVGVIPFRLDNVSQNSLPLKLFEYMACKVPVISTNVRGISDNFNDIVLYASNSKDYIHRISELNENEDLKKALGMAGRERMRNHFDWSKLSLKLEKLIADLTEVS